MTTQQSTVRRVVHAEAREVFAVLSDPRRHPELDGSGTLRAAPDAGVITGLGDEFVMQLHADDLGSYRSRSVVVRYEPDRAIAWSPGPVGERPFGHVYGYTLEPAGPGRTQVTQTYDWSAVTDPRLRGQLPRVSRDELARTLELLALAVESTTGSG
jgi:hypothetical protein